MSEKFSRGLSTTELNKVSSGFRKMLQKKFPEIIVDPNNLPKLDVISTGSTWANFLFPAPVRMKPWQRP